MKRRVIVSDGLARVLAAPLPHLVLSFVERHKGLPRAEGLTIDPHCVDAASGAKIVAGVAVISISLPRIT